MPSLLADLGDVPDAGCSVRESAARASGRALPIEPGHDVRARIQGAMSRYAEGHRDAFDVVFQLLWPLVREFTLRALASQADADDAAQDALLKVFSRVSTYDPGRDALGWALGIAYYEVLTLRKKSRRLREDGGDALAFMTVTASNTAEDELLAKELSAALHAALAQLPTADRELMTAAIRDAGPAVEGAASEVTVRKRRQRARERLREVWRRLHGSF